MVVKVEFPVNLAGWRFLRVELCPFKRYFEVLTCSTSECDLTWK